MAFLDYFSHKSVRPIGKDVATAIVVARHYLRRRPPISYAFGLFDLCGDLVGVITYGIPPSRHLQKGVNKDEPDSVIELNRLWVDDDCPRNSESYFVRASLKLLPARIVVSYADTKEGHFGYVYRACGFYYDGWTDQDRKTPRYDYHVEGKHSRDAFRGGEIRYQRIMRKPKVRYWTVTGNKTERRRLKRACLWNNTDWKYFVPPGEACDV